MLLSWSPCLILDEPCRAHCEKLLYISNLPKLVLFEKLRMENKYRSINRFQLIVDRASEYNYGV